MEEKLRLFISDHPFFKDISQSNRQINDIVKHSYIQKVDQYRILIQKDKPSCNLLFVLSGQVSIFIEKSKMEIEYERQLQLNLEEVKNNYEHMLQNEVEKNDLLKKTERQLKQVYVQVAKNQKQYEDPVYQLAFPIFYQDFTTNKTNIFPLKRVLTVNSGLVIGEGVINYPSENSIQRINNITVVSQTKATIAYISIEYIEKIIPLQKQNILNSSFENYFGQPSLQEVKILCQFFEKRIYDYGQIIVDNQENLDRIFVVGRGLIEVSTNFNNNQIKIFQLKECDIFGHENFTFERSYRAKCVQSDTIVYCIEKQLFFELIENKILFSQIAQIGDDKMIYHFQSLKEKVQSQMKNEIKNEKLPSNLQKSNNFQSDQEHIKQKQASKVSEEKTEPLFRNSVKLQLFDDKQINQSNYTLIIQGQINVQQKLRRSNTNNIEKNIRQLNQNKFKISSQSPPSQKDINKFIIKKSSLSPIQKLNSYEISNQTVINKGFSGQKYKKYKYGFGINSQQDKKANENLPKIRYQLQYNVDQNKKKHLILKNINKEGVIFQNELLQEAQFKNEEILQLNKNSNLTQSLLQKRVIQNQFENSLQIKESLQNQEQLQNLYENYLSDKSIYESFNQINEQFEKQNLSKTQISQSHFLDKSINNSQLQIQIHPKKARKRHYSFENINTRYIDKIISKKQNQTLTPLDSQHTKEKIRYNKDQQVEEILNFSQPLPQLNITQPIKEYLQFQNSMQLDDNQNFQKQNTVILNNDSSQNPFKDQQQISKQNFSLQITTSPDNQMHILSQQSWEYSPLHSNNLKYLQKKKQMSLQRKKQKQQNILKQNLEQKSINDNDFQLIFKKIPLKQPDIVNKQIEDQNTFQTQISKVQENNAILIYQPPNKQATNEPLIINGEKKIIRDKIQTNFSPLGSTQKQHENLIENKSQSILINNQNHPESILQISKSQPNEIQKLILKEQINNNNLPQIINNQTIPIMEKYSPISALEYSKQKNRSLTLEESRSKVSLNLSQGTDKFQSNKRHNTSMSPSLKFHKFSQIKNHNTTKEQIDINQENIVIKQNANKHKEIANILRHNGLIQNKLKRSFIRSSQTNDRYKVTQFKNHLKEYSDCYNYESLEKQLFDQNNLSQVQNISTSTFYETIDNQQIDILQQNLKTIS